jgi:hypothetical protein
MTAETIDKRPITFRIAHWYGFGFAGVFILYGVVSSILAVLDRNYANLGIPILMAVVGGVLMIFPYAFKGKKLWGWAGLMVIYLGTILFALLDLARWESVVLLILAFIALVALVVPATREYIKNQ